MNKKTILVLALSFLIPCAGMESGPANASSPRGKSTRRVPSEVRELTEKLYSIDPGERRFAARALGELGEKSVYAIPRLIELLGDRTRLLMGRHTARAPAVSVAEEAKQALVKIGAPAVDRLISALYHRDPLVRGMAAEALGDIKDSRAVMPLVETLEKDEDALVQNSAAQALGKIGDPRAVEALIGVQDHEYWAVRKNAGLALTKITGEAFGDDPSQWKAWWRKRNQPSLQTVVVDDRGEFVAVEEIPIEVTTIEETSAPEETVTEVEPVAGGRKEQLEGSPEERVHVVMKGESLHGIGLRYNISWVTLAGYNNLDDPGDIRAGQRLRIPPPGAVRAASSSTDGRTYRVRKGDTLHSVGRTFGVSWQEIARANGIEEVGRIYVGQRLWIPVKEPGGAP
jgi:LysM repeat protein